MAGRFTFHNKYHRSNHHTISALELPDSGLDPIASRAYPFMGIFYNVLTDQERTFTVETDSYQWWSAFTTVRANSATWMLTRSLYTTVSSLSDNWEAGFIAYTNFNAVSNLFVALYTTVSTFSAEWGSPYLMFTNRTQEYTHSKTFSGQDIRSDGYFEYDFDNTVTPALTTYNWDLDTQQVAFVDLNELPYEDLLPDIRPEVEFNNPVDRTMLQGGIYTLVVKQRTQLPPIDILFSTAYRFNDRNNRERIIYRALSGITVINFICVNKIMYGDVTYLSGNL